MPIPIIDASQALKASPEKTEDALLKVESHLAIVFVSKYTFIITQFSPLSHQIENYLYRNHETRKYLQEQAYRLQQGIVTTTTQQVCV